MKDWALPWDGVLKKDILLILITEKGEGEFYLKNMK